MKQEIHFTEQWKKKEYGNKIRPVYEIFYQRKILIKKFYKNMAWKLVSGPLLFLKDSLLRGI